MKVKDILEALKDLDPDMSIALSVNGHSWYSPVHKSSHGGGMVGQIQISYASGKKHKLCLISHSLGPNIHGDGYSPEITKVLFAEKP